MTLPLVFAPVLAGIYVLTKVVCKWLDERNKGNSEKVGFFFPVCPLACKSSNSVVVLCAITHLQMARWTRQNALCQQGLHGLKRRDTFANACLMMISLLYTQQVRRVLEVPQLPSTRTRPTNTHKHHLNLRRLVSLAASELGSVLDCPFSSAGFPLQRRAQWTVVSYLRPNCRVWHR